MRESRESVSTPFTKNTPREKKRDHVFNTISLLDDPFGRFT